MSVRTTSLPPCVGGSSQGKQARKEMKGTRTGKKEVKLVIREYIKRSMVIH